MTHPVSDQLGWEASQGPSVLDLCWETTLMAASPLPHWGHDDSLTAKITPSTTHHPLIPGNGQTQNIFHSKQEIRLWNVSKLFTCHFAASEGLPHVPKDQWESLPLPNSHLEQNLSEMVYFLFLLYKATFNLPNTFQPCWNKSDLLKCSLAASLWTNSLCSLGLNTTLCERTAVLRGFVLSLSAPGRVNIIGPPTPANFNCLWKAVCIPRIVRGSTLTETTHPRQAP